MELQVIRYRDSHACGTCTACCTLMGVKELGKPYGVTCKHVAVSGCDVYADRPYTCGAWSCQYVMGAMGDRQGLRPDKCGLMLAVEEGSYRIGVYVYEVWPGAFDAIGRDKAMYWVRKVAKRYPGVPDRLIYHPYGVTIGSGFPIDRATYPSPEGLEDKQNRAEGTGNVLTVRELSPDRIEIAHSPTTGVQGTT